MDHKEPGSCFGTIVYMQTSNSTSQYSKDSNTNKVSLCAFGEEQEKENEKGSNEDEKSYKNEAISLATC